MVSRSKRINPLMLILITVIGLVLGSLFSLIVDTLLTMVPGEGGNVLGVFTWSIPIGFGFPEALTLNLAGVLKFKFGFEMNINAMSFLGLWLSHRFYKSYQ